MFSIFSVMFAGCGSPSTENTLLATAKYDNVTVCEDVYSFLTDVSDHASATGVILSPYYSLKINDEEIPVYAARTAHGLHSFAYAFANAKDGVNPFNLNVSIKALADCEVIESKETEVEVLPLRRNVKPSLNYSNKTITATISDYGNYSFIFDKNYVQPITILVSPIDNQKELFQGKEVEYLLPGDYSKNTDAFKFSKENKVYYFKKGYYKIDTISIPSNSVIYFEPGAYFQVQPKGSRYGLTNTGTENIKILGHGILDYSNVTGGEDSSLHDKGSNIFNDIKGFEISGLTVTNSNTWTLCTYNSDDVYIHDVALFSFRVYSDGIMLSGCKNGLVERNFIRTGDDALEVKAAGAKRVCENVKFQYNDVWTDKGNAYGCIYETRQDIDGVSFQHNNIGFSLSEWSEHLGCISISLGDNKEDPKTIKNIKINDLEVYANYSPAIINFYYDGRAATYKGYGHIRDIYVSNVNVKYNRSPINTFVSFINHLPEPGGDVSKIGTFDNIVVSNLTSNGVTLSMLNQDTEGYIKTKFYSGEGYTPPEVKDILYIRNGNTYE